MSDSDPSLPTAVEAEELVLGTMLARPEIIPVELPKLPLDDITDPHNRLIYAELCKLSGDPEIDHTNCAWVVGDRLKAMRDAARPPA